jgi:outer membrane protein OmpA-like peptidoglycan-associated protein
MKFRILKFAALAVITLPAVAMAEERVPQDPNTITGWYTGIAGGLNNLSDSEIEGPGLFPGKNGFDYGLGWAALAAVGYDWGYFRVEAETNFRTNNADFSYLTTDAAGTMVSVGTTGGLETFGFMANGLVDLLNGYSLTPYIGVGAGWAKVDSDIAGLDDSDGVFMFQGIGGLSYRFYPNTLLTLDYRYFSSFDDVELQTSTVPVGSIPRELEFDNHAVMLGLRFTFGDEPVPTVMPAPQIVRTASPKPMHRPAAAPLPAPEPEPVAEPKVPETYVVFFAFDRSEISPVAATILERAISDFQENGLTRIVVEGHADRSGTDAYNENLSRARAQAVATFLMGKGVATDNIETAWFGESRPRVETDDGIRNEENRRAEIFLRR